MNPKRVTTRRSQASPKVRFSIVTAPAPGAIGIIQLHGVSVVTLLRELTGAADFTGARLVDFGEIDQGLAVMLRDDWAQLFPHGGPRVMQRLTQRLIELGAEPVTAPDPREVYPEAGSDLEADMLDALAKAASPAAIDRLLDQPRRWLDWFAKAPSPFQGEGRGEGQNVQPPNHARRHDHVPGFTPHPASPLEGRGAVDPRDHLITPPAVVLVGPANVGKSTLSNLVTGRAMSLTADLPGTTRDWVAGLAELPTPIGELAVRWFDTPGLRQSDDPIEQRAIELAGRVIESADVLIAVADPASGFADSAACPRQPDLFVMNKADLLVPLPPGEVGPAGRVRASSNRSHVEARRRHSAEAPSPQPSPGGRGSPDIHISALTGQGLEALSAAIADRLGLTSDTDADTGPWAFCERLRCLAGSADRQALGAYLGA
ncbi:hypothetical protein HED60_03690 [Planctomycetales bacterium ZRK34]|nr:hypothetical protein HED60_03690 [Planctomycetales bacterium ZRK34]